MRFTDLLEQGSSPLTRGKRGIASTLSGAMGLIPAHAGKTPGPVEWYTRAWAHPRSRGENTSMSAIVSKSPGSSPLTRGKPPLGAPVGRARRLIPAHAGKTRIARKTRVIARAHPRSRGENCRAPSRWKLLKGSSPLTRGKPPPKRPQRRCRGLIPAHAGKTLRPWWRRGSRGAHPRSRGENRCYRWRERHRWGSSPLTRGKLRQRRQGCPVHRLIPAHAGKTPSVSSSTGAAGAHPRSRGENMKKADAEALKQGSSPLTRGKPLSSGFMTLDEGLIPAHAGKTTTRGAGRSS